ncbi:MAG TPA: hypothetical protein VM008_08970 [Phycisphaerae bacterium]|nr:hypothetical protein [Phycisphaerae bacterium]
MDIFPAARTRLAREPYRILTPQSLKRSGQAPGRYGVGKHSLPDSGGGQPFRTGLPNDLFENVRVARPRKRRNIHRVLGPGSDLPVIPTQPIKDRPLFSSNEFNEDRVLDRPCGLQRLQL